MDISTITSWIPVIVALIAAFGALCGYIYQSRRSIKEKKLTSKQAQYERLIWNVFLLLSAKPGICYAKVLTEIEQSWLYASDDVLNRCYDMLEVHKELCKNSDRISALVTDDQLREKFNIALGNLYVSMRKDLGFGTNLKMKNWPKDKVKLFPLGILAEPPGEKDIASNKSLDRGA